MGGNIFLVGLFFLQSLNSAVAEAPEHNGTHIYSLQKYPIPIPKNLPAGSTVSLAHPDAPSAPQTDFLIKVCDTISSLCIQRSALSPLLNGTHSQCDIHSLNTVIKADLAPLRCKVRFMVAATQIIPQKEESDSEGGEYDDSDDPDFSYAEGTNTELNDLTINLLKKPSAVAQVIISGLKSAIESVHSVSKTVQFYDPKNPNAPTKNCQVCWLNDKKTNLSSHYERSNLVVTVNLVREMPGENNMLHFKTSQGLQNVLIFKADLSFIVRPISFANHT